MMTFAGRTVVMTTLDPIPPGLRTMPKCVALNAREVVMIERELARPRGAPGPVWRRLMSAIRLADDAEMLAAARARRTKSARS